MNRRELMMSMWAAGVTGLTGAEEDNASREEQRAAYVKAIYGLRDLVKTQCSDGNWNYDPYMHGLANGLILALSLFEGGRPQFLDAPAVWMADISAEVAVKAGAGEQGND